MKVSIVIPWYNTEELVKKNLPPVLAAAKNPENNVTEVIVVDDKSPDKSAELVKNNFPEIRLIQHKVNRGFPSAVNTGFRSAKGELVCLLNSDVVPERNFLKACLTHFSDPKIFAVSFNEGGPHSWARGYFKDGFIEHESGGKSEKAHTSFWASGGSAIYRRRVWIEIGGFDEKVFTPFYWEDLDIGYRAQKRGYRILWEPGAKVEHNHFGTIGKLNQNRVEKIKERNQLLFIWKNITSTGLFRKHLAGLLRRVFMHPGYAFIVVSALIKLGPLIKSRRREIKESKISDEAVLARFS